MGTTGGIIWNTQKVYKDKNTLLVYTNMTENKKIELEQKLKSEIQEANIVSMNTMTKYIEVISVKNAKFILNTDYGEFKCLFWDKDELNVCGEKWDLKVYYTQVRKFCKRVVKNRVKGEKYAELEQSYKHSAGASNGRLYVRGFGVQSLQSKIRKFLTGDTMVDIDMCNAHPTILLNIVNKFNAANSVGKIRCNFLKQYVENRSEILETHHFEKNDFLICLNSDKLITNKKEKGFYTKNNFLIDFHREKTEIYRRLIEDTDYIKKYEIKTSNTKNPISSKINKLLCIKENQALKRKVKTQHIVPMFDGFMIRIEDKDKYDYMIELDENIKWAFKDNSNTIFDTSEWEEGKSKDFRLYYSIIMSYL
jgi:hypothetical protein